MATAFVRRLRAPIAILTQTAMLFASLPARIAHAEEHSDAPDPTPAARAQTPSAPPSTVPSAPRDEKLADVAAATSKDIARAIDAPVTGGDKTGGEAAARKTLQWIRDVGFDDVLCMARPESLDDLARLRDALA